MNRLYLFLTGLLLASPFLSTVQGNDRPPNIILILADDVSAREFGVYGHPQHKTPNLDRMARDGVYFQTAWSAPICSPSRAEIMTGRYAHQTQWYHNSMKPDGEAGNFLNQFTTLGTMMKAAGYQTAITGKWQLPGTAAEGGFDEYCLWEDYDGFDGPVEDETMVLPGRSARYWHPSIVQNGKPIPTGSDDYGPDYFADFIQDYTSRHRDVPFFIYYPMCLPHASWDFERNQHSYLPTPKIDDQGNRIPGEQTPPSLRANVEYIDALVGRIEANLKRQGLLENTIILFTGDNGTDGYGKGNLWQERGPRVPFIAYGPGHVKPRGARPELIDFSDVLPTLADLADHPLPDPQTVDGESFEWVLAGTPGTPRSFIFAPYGTHKMVRTEQWLLDGEDRLWFCGDHRDEVGYLNMTDRKKPAAIAAFRQLQEIADRYPLPPPDSKMVAVFRNQEKRSRERHERLKSQRMPQIIPQPVHTERHSGSFPLKPDLTIVAPSNAAFTATQLQAVITELCGAAPNLSIADPAGNSAAGDLRLQLEPERGLGREGYRLEVKPTQVLLTASHPAGLFYGLQTLRQLLIPAAYHGEAKGEYPSIPSVTIDDYPRFAWRGLMLDVGHHYFEVEYVKRFIDLMALHKLNTFHWHLTGEQGWRIEIKAFPELTDVGSSRLIDAANPESDITSCSGAYGFYTQDDIREVVAYAAERHIRVVPEIDLLGYAQALLAACPQFACTAGIPTEILCAGNEEAYPFIQQVLSEVMDLFPSPYIHLGAEAVNKEDGRNCSKCQDRIKHLDLGNEKGLQRYFVNRMVTFLADHGRRAVGWDDIVDDGVDVRATVMHGRDDSPEGKEARAISIVHDVVSTRNSYSPLDPSSSIPMPTLLENAYAFEPMPQESSKESRDRLLGIQGNLWTEHIAAPAQVEYALYPWASALAERAWSPWDVRDYKDFLRRLHEFKTLLLARRVHYFDPLSNPERD